MREEQKKEQKKEQIKERQKELSAKKELYMIGNSHIDPVWFWTWEEGMQEVKATYASALERMKAVSYTHLTLPTNSRV